VSGGSGATTTGERTAGRPRSIDELGTAKHRTRREEVFRRFVRNRTAVAGCIVFIGLLLVAAFAPFIAPYDPPVTSREVLAAPSSSHLMGTDHIGRDVFSRVVYGTRYSLRMGVVAVLIGGIAGSAIGLIAGHYGGGVDNVLMRCIDALMSFPGILLALVIATTLGTGLFNAMIAVGIAWIPQFARLVRSNVLQVRAMPYIEAARSEGVDEIRLMMRHIFPNVTTPIIVLGSLGVASAILIGSSLSFLGLGAQPPTPEWGAILSQGRQYIDRAWWVMAFPGLAITITVMAANLIGDGLRDALDPKMKV